MKTTLIDLNYLKKIFNNIDQTIVIEEVDAIIEDYGSQIVLCEDCAYFLEKGTFMLQTPFINYLYNHRINIYDLYIIFSNYYLIAHTLKRDNGFGKIVRTEINNKHILRPAIQPLQDEKYILLYQFEMFSKKHYFVYTDIYKEDVDSSCLRRYYVEKDIPLFPKAKYTYYGRNYENILISLYNVAVRQLQILVEESKKTKYTLLLKYYQQLKDENLNLILQREKEIKKFVIGLGYKQIKIDINEESGINLFNLRLYDEDFDKNNKNYLIKKDAYSSLLEDIRKNKEQKDYLKLKREQESLEKAELEKVEKGIYDIFFKKISEVIKPQNCFINYGYVVKYIKLLCDKNKFNYLNYGDNKLIVGEKHKYLSNQINKLVMKYNALLREDINQLFEENKDTLKKLLCKNTNDKWNLKAKKESDYLITLD